MLYPLLGIESPFHVALSQDGEQHTVDLAGVPLSQLPQDRERRGGAYKFLDDGRIAVLKVYGFGDEKGEKPLSALLQEAFEKIHERNSSSLIIDVRDNGGGQDVLGKQLLSYLLYEPFMYYDYLVINALSFDFLKYCKHATPVPAFAVKLGADGKFHQVTHPNWGMQQPGDPTFRGRVFVLMNGGSFSTTCEFLSNLHYRHRAVFIGSEPGGAYYGNTSGYTADVVLPNSKLQIDVPLTTYNLAAKGNPQAARWRDAGPPCRVFDSRPHCRRGS